MIFQFSKYHCFLKLHVFLLFVLLLRATCRWRWLWSDDMMTLAGRIWITRGKPVPIPHFSPQISQGQMSDRTQVSVLKGRRLTAWAISRSTCWIALIDIICKVSVCTLQRTRCDFVRKISQLLPCKGTVALCRKKHTKHKCTVWASCIVFWCWSSLHTQQPQCFDRLFCLFLHIICFGSNWARGREK